MTGRSTKQSTKSTNSASRLATFPPSTVPPRSSICVVPPISCKRNAIIEPIHRHVNDASQLLRSPLATVPIAEHHIVPSAQDADKFHASGPLTARYRERRENDATQTSRSTTAPRAVARHRVPTSHSLG